MAGALEATPRVLTAVRTADGLGRNLVPGKKGRKSIPGGVSGDTYSGPFQVIIKNDTTVTVKAYDGTTYLSKNYIIMGLDRVEQSIDVDVTITIAGIVYGKIVFVDPNYVLTFVNASVLPDQIKGEEYFTVADILFVSSIVTKVNQVLRGEYHSQRIV